jgi:hypothetical protein
MSRAGETTPGPDQQKFFAAFFKKRSACLLRLIAIRQARRRFDVELVSISARELVRVCNKMGHAISCRGDKRKQRCLG